MKRDLKLGNINDIISHFWAGSLDSHNFHNKESIKKSKTLIDAGIDASFEAYNVMRLKLMKKYNMKKQGKYLVNSEGNFEIAEAFWKEYEEQRAEYAFTVYQNSIIFNKDQVNTIFNIVWMLAGDLSKKYKCPFKGFRFAINGGCSAKRSSASINTLSFLWKTKEESWENVLEKCLHSFAWYIYCYSEENSIRKIHEENSRKKDNWNAFDKWYKEVVNDLIVGKFTYLTQLWGA